MLKFLKSELPLFIFDSMRKHLLTMLLSLEFIVLMLFLLFIYLYMIDNENYLLMMFLMLSMYEGALRLSILVSLIRTHGNDHFQSFSIL